MSKLSFRSNLIIFLICSFIFFGTHAIAILLSEDQMTEACREKAEKDLDYLLSTFDVELSRAQEAANAFASLVFENGEQVLSEEVIYRRMESFLKTNTIITGIAAGFEDDIYPQYANDSTYGFIPLIRNQKKEGLVRYQMGEVRDVRHENDWYSFAFEHDMRVWSRPWMSEDKDMITTYSIPLHKDGRKIGVFAVDLSLEHLDEVAHNTRPTPDATVTVMLSTDLTYIIHPNPSYVLTETMPSACKKLGIPASDELFENVKARKRGKEIVSWGKHSSYMVYAPVEKARCVAMVDIPLQTVYEPAKMVMWTMIISSCVGLMILALFLWVRNEYSENIIKFVKKFKKEEVEEEDDSDDFL